MVEHIRIITNNPMSLEKFKDKFQVEFLTSDVLEVFRKTRDYIHLGHRLLTHPLVSSIKPNEVAYRTVIISRDRDNNIDIYSLNIIEESIVVTEKFLKDFKLPAWNERILADLQLIDYDLISSGLI